MKKGAPRNIYITPALWGAMQKQAELDDRSVSNMVTVVLKRYLAGIGISLSDEDPVESSDNPPGGGNDHA